MVKGRIGQSIVKKYRISYLSMSLFLLVSCSDNQGELVKKSPASSSATPVQIAEQPILPDGHPPIGGSGMAQMMGSRPGAMPPGVGSEPVITGSTVRVAGLEFEIDPAWISEKPQGIMRAAQFHIPSAEGAGNDGELSIFQGIGGSADANLERWISQFGETAQDPKIEKKKVGTLSVQTLDVSGSLTISTIMGGQGTAQAGSRMLAAVVEGASGGPWHFKLIGPEKTLEYWKPAFDTLIDSLKPLN